ncbi:MAG: hypothetical protein N2595_10625, partial [bacterium]|nr:hypothetical protein [bacterium]
CEEGGGRAKICLFTKLAINEEEANRVLREAGFSSLARITHVVRVEQIPVLGTGKIDYRTLQEKVEQKSEV